MWETLNRLIHKYWSEHIDSVSADLSWAAAGWMMCRVSVPANRYRVCVYIVACAWMGVSFKITVTDQQWFNLMLHGALDIQIMMTDKQPAVSAATKQSYHSCECTKTLRECLSDYWLLLLITAIHKFLAPDQTAQHFDIKIWNNSA